MKLSNIRKNDNYLENLNKRDIYKFRKFLEQIKKGTGDEHIDKCIPLLVKYIEIFYISDENKTFDLDDFIQECMFKITEIQDDEVFSLVWTLTHSFKNIYDEMSQSTDYDFVEPIDFGEEYDEINLDEIMNEITTSEEINKRRR